MVDVQVNAQTAKIEETNVESNLVVAGALTTFESIDIRSTIEARDSSGAPGELDYEFLVGTSGAAAGVNVNVNHRSHAVGDNTTPDTINNFFTSIANTGRLHAIPRVNRNGVVTYDMFFTNVGTGLIDAELITQTLVVPPGQLTPVIPTTAAVIDVVVVFREFRGVDRVYDVFVLEGV